MSTSTKPDFQEAVSQLGEAVRAKKCWPCGCLRSSLESIQRALPDGSKPRELSAVLQSAEEKLQAVKYDCLGCQVCYPAIAVNALNVDVDACPTDDVEERNGWPPLPGSYTTLRYQAPVAVCTLTNEALTEAIAAKLPEDVAIVGTLQTENLGIERIVLNTLANPHIRFLVLCGADTQQAVGHLPGQSLVALAQSGVDERMRIIDAHGRRPRLPNVSSEAVAHFRKTVEVIDLIGVADSEPILEAVAEAAHRNPGPAQPFAPERTVRRITGSLPDRMVSDPSGYLVIYPDRPRGLLLLEHYQNNGVLDLVIEGRTAPELYSAAIANALLSRLDHAAYLDRELARAERALTTDEPYVQDHAPEQKEPAEGNGCGCGPSCGDSQ